MATGVHKRLAYQETTPADATPVSKGDKPDARPRKRRKFAHTPSNHSNGVNGIKDELVIHPQDGTAKVKRRPSVAPFQSLGGKPGPPGQFDKRELPIFSGKQVILDAFQTNDTIVIVGEPGSGKTTRSSLTLVNGLFLTMLDS
jgi:HrpA-like RNA helicase